MSSIPVEPSQSNGNIKNVPVRLFSEELYGQLGLTSKPVLEELEETIKLVSGKIHAQFLAHAMSEAVYPTYLIAAMEEFDNALRNLKVSFDRYGMIEAANEKIKKDKSDGFYKVKHGN